MKDTIYLTVALLSTTCEQLPQSHTPTPSKLTPDSLLRRPLHLLLLAPLPLRRPHLNLAFTRLRLQARRVPQHRLVQLWPIRVRQGSPHFL